jgi:site-specific DNA recombinase
MKTRKAILYVRVSTDEQAEKGYSLSHQEERLRSYCLHNNIEVVAFFREDHSAKSFERPQFKKLLEFIKGNKKLADMLLFLKWDRFSRNAADAYAMINQLMRLGVEPQAMEQPLNMEIPEHKFMLAIYLAAPEVENDRRSLNILAGMRKAMKEGRWMGTAPKGYKRSRDESNRPCIVPAQEESLIKWAYEQMATGNYHIDEVRKMVNKKGLIIQRAAFWWMMRSPVYIGKVIVPSYKDEPMMIVPGQHEPIISERLFYEVQDVLEGKKRKDLPAHFSKREDLPLRGYFKCTACGRNLTGSASKGNGGKYFYYHCKNGCKERFRATEGNDSFYEYLDEISGNEKAIRSWEKILKDYYLKDNKEKGIEKEKVSKELELLKKRLSNAQMMTLDGALDPSEYRNIKAKLEPEIERLIRKQMELDSKEDNVEEILEYGFHFLRNLPELFAVATLEEKSMILGSTFPEKLVFQNGTVRTACPDSAISVLIKPRKDFTGNKKGSAKIFALPSGQVEDNGVEPMTSCMPCKRSSQLS